MRPFLHAALRPLLGLLFAAAFVSCTKARPTSGDGGRCVSWEAEIEPIVAGRCVSCHAGPAASAGYDLSSYAGALAGGADETPNVIAGDRQSKILAVLDPAAGDATHQGLRDVFPSIESWVVDCQASFVASSIHRPGILDPASADFHGKLLAREKYDFGSCQKCHGESFEGGTSRVACTTCHKDGPTACSTCHGAIAKDGLHGRHLGQGPSKKVFGCDECHVVPTTYKDPGHIFLADGSLDPAPAEITLKGRAALTPVGSTRAGPPAWDEATQTCSNVYCHGGVWSDVAATDPQPSWKTSGAAPNDCSTCHGLPPRHAGRDTCVSCHSQVVDRENKIIAADKHIDGVVELGDAAKGCAGCHGKGMTGAPPPDLTGGTTRDQRGVGAHEAHLNGLSHLAPPVTCRECHLVPANVEAPGHFGGHQVGADAVAGAEVFVPDPSGVVGDLASRDGAKPQWDSQAVTCAGVYCHGGGMKLASDTTPGLVRSPVWTALPTAPAAVGLVCGQACHGLPPTFAPHLATMTRADCASCHPRTVDPTGQIILSGPIGAETSAHMNGVLDVAP